MSSGTATLRPTSAFPSTTSSSSLRQQATKKSMSLTQTYYLAHKARGKLSREAAQPDHDLRLLVGHANLLDTLMLELADAEREQENWFNQSVRGATSPKKAEAGQRRVQWADQTIEEVDEEDYEEDSASDSSDDDFDVDVEMVAPTMVAQTTEEEDIEEDYAQLGLVRTRSHSASTQPDSPPELIEHDGESSEDESMPPSPVQSTILAMTSKKEAQEHTDALSHDDEFYRTRTVGGLVSAISVY